jgi:hypothetical protein
MTSPYSRRPPLGPTSFSGLFRGLTNMMSYYAMIGVLLGVFALCCGGPLAIFAWPDRQDSSSRSPHNQPDARTPAWMRPYVGDWGRHGQSMHITARGAGTYRSRTYTPCDSADQQDDLPCEQEAGDMPIRVEFSLAQANSAVVARVETSTYAEFAGDMPIELPMRGVMIFADLQFCDENNPPPLEDREGCGA